MTSSPTDPLDAQGGAAAGTEGQGAADAAAPAPGGPGGFSYPAAPDAATGPSTDAAADPAHDQEGDQVGDVAAELVTAKAAVAALTNDLQRLQAEYVNYKRRVDRDRDLVKQNATFSVLTSLLPVLDDVDRAREHGELEGGFKAIADALERAVASQGLTKFGRPGDEFDPRLHEALMHGHSADVTTTTCQTIVSAGYSIGDRVVRPAQVTVVDPAPAAEPGAADGTGTDGDSTSD